MKRTHIKSDIGRFIKLCWLINFSRKDFKSMKFCVLNDGRVAVYAPSTKKELRVIVFGAEEIEIYTGVTMGKFTKLLKKLGMKRMAGVVSNCV